MDLKDYLKQIATDLQFSTENKKVFNSVFYGSDYETNAQAADEAAYPMCQILPPLSSGIEISSLNGRVSDRWNVFIYFSDIQPQNMDATAEENETIKTRMREAAKLYINKLNRSGLFQPITKAEFKHLSFKFDATTSGILAFFTLNEKPGVIYC